jgi:hypothetical protein
MMDNQRMVKFISIAVSCLVLGCFFSPATFAQDPVPADEDDSSEQVEQREDSYRRQMELEDARSRDRTYIDNTYTQSATAEKIDKLPEESRDNIRDQLVDIIMENGEWEPRDALEEYPYRPTAAAEADAELKEQEQAAWDEQVEKYHQREAAAFGSYRGPVPGPGNPGGAEGGQQGDGQGGQSGGGGDGEEESESGSAGTYQPYQAGSSRPENGVSTAGVSESALDFLRGGQSQSQQETQEPSTQAAAEAQTAAEAQAQAAAEAQAQAAAEAQAQAAAEEQAQQEAENNPAQSAAEYLAGQSPPENPQESSEQSTDQSAEQEPSTRQDSSAEVPVDLRGIIAIEDLNKLEGTQNQDPPEDPESRDR